MLSPLRYCAPPPCSGKLPRLTLRDQGLGKEQPHGGGEKMSYATFQRRWQAFSEPQRARVRAKANWEGVTLWAVMNEWWEEEDP